MISATYFDGRIARAQPVRVTVSAGQLLVALESDQVLRFPLSALRVQEPFRNVPLRIELGGGALIEAVDGQALKQMLADAGVSAARRVPLHYSWAWATGSIAAVLLLIWAAYVWLLPVAARQAIALVPASVEQKIGDSVWPSIDTDMFNPTIVGADRQQRLREQFANLARLLPDPPAWQLEFRSGKEGPNAFAIPGGRIVVTDQLIARASSDEAVLGVLAHELGHVYERHSLRLIAQSMALSAVLSVWFGDFSALLVAVPTSMASMSYSRGFEHDADTFAIDLMRRAGLSTRPMADLLESLDPATAGDGKSAAPSATWWSTHPMTAERLARLRAR